jgi:hypothetical protein
VLCRLGEGTGPKGPANGEAPLRLRREASSYLPVHSFGSGSISRRIGTAGARSGSAVAYDLAGTQDATLVSYVSG